MKRKRFYRKASFRQDPAQEGIWIIELDGKPIKTPGRAFLTAGSEAIARAVAAEWQAQKEYIHPETMPLSSILYTKIDRVAQEREAMTSQILPYIDTDLICYFAPDEPAGLFAEQEAAWNPVLQDISAFAEVTPLTTRGLSALRQPKALHQRISHAIHQLDTDRFTILQMLVPSTGSVFLAYVFLEGKLTAEALFQASHIEEHFMAKLYHEDIYGPDPAQEKKFLAKKREFEACGQYLELLRTGGSIQSRQ